MLRMFVMFVLGFCFGWLAVREHERSKRIDDFIAMIIFVSKMPMTREIDEWATNCGYINLLNDTRAAGKEVGSTDYGTNCFFESVERHNRRANGNV